MTGSVEIAAFVLGLLVIIAAIVLGYGLEDAAEKLADPFYGDDDDDAPEARGHDEG